METLADWLAALADPAVELRARGPALDRLLGETVVDLAAALLNGRRPNPSIRHRAAVLAAVQAGREAVVEGEVERPSPNVVVELPDGRRFEGVAVATASPRAVMAWLWPVTDDDGLDVPAEAIVQFLDGTTFVVSRQEKGCYRLANAHGPGNSGAVDFRVRPENAMIHPLGGFLRVPREMFAAVAAFAVLHETPADGPQLLGLRPYDGPVETWRIFRQLRQFDPLTFGLLDRRLAQVGRSRSRAVRFYAAALREALREHVRRGDLDRNPPFHFAQPRWFRGIDDLDEVAVVEASDVAVELPDGALRDDLLDLALRALWALWRRGVVRGTALHLADGTFVGAQFRAGPAYGGRILEVTTRRLSAAPRPLSLRVITAPLWNREAPEPWGWLTVADGLLVAWDDRRRWVHAAMHGTELPVATLLAALPPAPARLLVHGVTSTASLKAMVGVRTERLAVDPFEGENRSGMPISRGTLTRLLTGVAPEVATEWSWRVDFRADM